MKREKKVITMHEVAVLIQSFYSSLFLNCFAFVKIIISQITKGFN